MYKKLQNTANKQIKFWRLDNWLMYFVVIIILLIAFPLYRYIIKQLQKNAETQQSVEIQQNYVANQNPAILQPKLDAITTSASVQAYAKEIYHHLGVGYQDEGGWSLLNPKGWTENDTRVADIVIYQRKNYTLLKKLYYQLSKSRDLTKDLLELLDSDQLKRVRKYVNI